MNLGSSQYLFTVVVNPSEMPCLCLRYDVDAIVLQPRPEQPENMWEHIATFNALGMSFQLITPFKIEHNAIIFLHIVCTVCS